MKPIGVILGNSSFPTIKMARIDENAQIFKNQFVEVSYSNSSESYPILGRIIDVEIKNALIGEGLIPHFPENEDIKSIDDLGIPRNFTENVIATVEVLGYSKNGKIIKPLFPPRPGDFIFPAREETLKNLFKTKNAINIGTLRENPNVLIYLDYQELISKHFAVLAMTGAGKSHTVSVIIEELSKYNIPIVVFDPHGEYSSMIAPRKDLKDKEIEKAQKISSKVKIFVPGDTYEQYEKFFEERYGIRRQIEKIRIHPAELDYIQISHLLQSVYGLSQAQSRVLEKSWDDIRYTYEIDKNFEYTMIEKTIREHIEGKEEIAARTLISKLKMLWTKTYFGKQKLDVHKFVEKDRISIIDLSGLELIDQQTISAIIAREIFNARKIHKTIPPVLIILEEAHKFIPSKITSASTSTFKKIAAEGRKFLVGLGVISQRPSKLDSDVLSQCNTQIILRLVNPNDQSYVRNVSEGLSASDLDTIKGLGTGEALIVGISTPFPVLTKIKDRLTMHGGFTPSIKKELEGF